MNSTRLLDNSQDDIQSDKHDHVIITLNTQETSQLSEKCYPRDFLLIKNQEDEYRSNILTNVHAYGYYHGLIKVESNYLKEIGLDQDLNPQITSNFKSKQMYNSKQVEALVDKFVNVVKDVFPTIPPNQLVIAGGSIASLFHDKFSTITQDLDVFVIGDINKSELKNSLKGRGCSFNENVISVSQFVENIDVGTCVVPGFIKIQLIKRRYNSLSEILHGFDIDSSCIAVECHTKDIYVSKRFDYAYRNGYNTVDLDRLSPSYECRLFKYSRRGWRIFVPGVSRARGFDVTDQRLDTWKYINTNIKGIAKRFKITKSQFWKSSSGLTRLAIINGFGTDVLDILDITKYTSDYYRGPMFKNVEKHLCVFNNWIIENPGTQHTSSFHPLPNDKSWYDSSIEELENLIEVSTDVVREYELDSPFIQMHNLRELPDGSYISVLFKDSVNQPSKPSKYYYLVNAMLPYDVFRPLNLIASMSVYDSEVKEFVGMLSGAHAGIILPTVFYYGPLWSDISPNIELITTNRYAINLHTKMMKKCAEEGTFADAEFLCTDVVNGLLMLSN